MSKRRVLPLLLMAVVALILAGASLPHTHTASNPGIWNADHDLALMAAFGTHASQPDAMPVIGIALVVATAVSTATARLAAGSRRLCDPRAPPRS